MTKCLYEQGIDDKDIISLKQDKERSYIVRQRARKSQMINSSKQVTPADFR